MALQLITPPTTEPLDLMAAKMHLRVDTTEDDALITSLIVSARQYCEGFQNRAYITQTWELWLDAWPDREYIRIPLPPLQSVESVKYYGIDDTEYIMPTADYFIDTKNEPGRIVLGYGKCWPSVILRPANAVVIRFTAGYGGVVTVPERVKQAMLLLMSGWYEQRESFLIGKAAQEVPFAVNALLWQDRVVL